MKMTVVDGSDGYYRVIDFEIFHSRTEILGIFKNGDPKVNVFGMVGS
jgi:hypothetical protein